MKGCSHSKLFQKHTNTMVVINYQNLGHPISSWKLIDFLPIILFDDASDTLGEFPFEDRFFNNGPDTD